MNSIIRPFIRLYNRLRKATIVPFTYYVCPHDLCPVMKMRIVDKHSDSMRSTHCGFPNEVLECAECLKAHRYPLYRWWELRAFRGYTITYRGQHEKLS